MPASHGNCCRRPRQTHRSALKPWALMALGTALLLILSGCAWLPGQQAPAQHIDFSEQWQAIDNPVAPATLAANRWLGLPMSWTRDWGLFTSAAELAPAPPLTPAPPLDTATQVTPSPPLALAPAPFSASLAQQAQTERWFEKTFITPRDWQGRSVWLSLTTPADTLELWLNHVRIGEFNGAFVPHLLELSTHLQPPGQTNRLWLRARLSPSSAVPESAMAALLDFSDARPALRQLQLDIKPEVFLAPTAASIQQTLPDTARAYLPQDLSATPNTDTAGTAAQIGASPPEHAGLQLQVNRMTDASATISLRTWVVNRSAKIQLIELTQTLEYALKPVAQTRATALELAPHSGRWVEQQLKLDKAHWWSPAQPALYQLHTQLQRGAQLLDRRSHSIGLRELRRIGDFIEINGETWRPRVAYHDLGFAQVGSLSGAAAQLRDALTIKAAGFDAVRLAPALQTPEFLSAADSIGLLVLPEVAASVAPKNPAPAGQSIARNLRDTAPDLAHLAQQLADCHARNRRDQLRAAVVSQSCDASLAKPLQAASAVRDWLTPERQVKPAFYAWQSQRDPRPRAQDLEGGPMVFMLTPWLESSSTQQSAAPSHLRLYSNTDTVLVQMDDQAAIAAQPLPADKSAARVFEVPLPSPTPARFHARGLLGDAVVVEQELIEPGPAVRLSLFGDSAGVPPREGVRDTIFVYARLLDSAGQPVMLDGVPVRFSLRGDARLLSPPVVHTQAGVAAAQLEIGDNLADVRLTARSAPLKGVTLALAKYKLW